MKKSLKGSATLNSKEMEKIIDSLIEMEHLALALERKGVIMKDYLEAIDEKKKKYPLYKLVVNHKVIFVYDDDKLETLRRSG